MTYRDETTALRERNAALEVELAEKSRALALRSETPATPPTITRNKRLLLVGAVALVLGIALAAMIVALSLVTPLRPPYDVFYPIVGISSLVLATLGSAAFAGSCWFVAPAGVALLSTFGGVTRVTFPGHGRFVWPMSDVRAVSIEHRTVASVVSCKLDDDASATVRVSIVVGTNETAEGVERFARRWSPAQEREIEPFVSALVDAAAREVFAHVTERELDRERSKITDGIEAALRDPVERAGLVIAHVGYTVEPGAVVSRA